MRKGFTLLELIVVIIIIGILGTLGFTQYTKVVEKGRTAEAKTILGQMRTAYTAYVQEYNANPTITQLSVEAPTDCSGATHYFSYGTSGASGTATRCSSGGKTPAGAYAYTIGVNYTTGVWSGTAGYF